MVIKKVIRKRDETGRNIRVVSDECEFHSIKETLQYTLNEANHYFSNYKYLTNIMLACQFRIMDSNEDFGICCQAYTDDTIDDGVKYEIYFHDDPFYDNDSVFKDMISD